MQQKQKIEVALRHMLERENDDAFVIIEDRTSGKFVQFSGNTFQDIIFDLPGQALDPVEVVRARALLCMYDIPFEEWDIHDEPGGAIVGRQSGFRKSLGRNTELAATIAWRTLTEAYSLNTQITLAIEEN